MIRLLRLIAVVAVALTMAGCREAQTRSTPAPTPNRQTRPIAEVGQECVVHFRRDALGASGRPIGPATGTFDNTRVFISGGYIRMDEDWLVIRGTMEDPANQIYIPREMILLVEVIQRQDTRRSGRPRP